MEEMNFTAGHAPLNSFPHVSSSDGSGRGLSPLREEGVGGGFMTDDPGFEEDNYLTPPEAILYRGSTEAEAASSQSGYAEDDVSTSSTQNTPCPWEMD